MTIWARINHVGWVHLWRRREDFEAAEPSAHFFNGRSDPRWAEAELDPEQLRRLATGELVEIEDPGYLDSDSDEA
ncbi:hypothetical protein GETHPA_03720 [Geothrix rubra]|uniref:Uncharacterized protein n=1 Tax=Geothrix rubra TaxID=2927977 RepID=A0ABQ5Q2W9_9BACT|nr:hypothetical protein [Geothrix rubra]GLH68839.1 hypothetical protein GETHPA_03720 [Geothrix rubra]